MNRPDLRLPLHRLRTPHLAIYFCLAVSHDRLLPEQGTEHYMIASFIPTFNHPHLEHLMLFTFSFPFDLISLFISVYHNSPGTSLGHACLLLGLFHFNSMISLSFCFLRLHILPFFSGSPKPPFFSLFLVIEYC